MTLTRPVNKFSFIYAGPLTHSNQAVRPKFHNLSHHTQVAMSSPACLIHIHTGCSDKIVVFQLIVSFLLTPPPAAKGSEELTAHFENLLQQ